MNKEKMLEEFNEYFKGNIDDKSFLHCNTIYVKSFLLNKIAEALAEDKERVVGIIEKEKARCTDVLHTECCNDLLSSLKEKDM